MRRTAVVMYRVAVEPPCASLVGYSGRAGNSAQLRWECFASEQAQAGPQEVAQYCRAAIAARACVVDARA